MKGKNNLSKAIAKNVATAGALLAICILSQFLKNISVYITGPIINACLILAVITVGYEWAVILSVITPITAFIITGNPLISAVPIIMPCIMAGNVILVSLVSLFVKKKVTGKRFVYGMATGSILKSVFMGVTISYFLIPMFISEASPLFAKIGVFQFTMSVTRNR